MSRILNLALPIMCMTLENNYFYHSNPKFNDTNVDYSANLIGKIQAGKPSSFNHYNLIKCLHYMF